MVVIPEYDRWERHLTDQLVDRTFDRQCPQADILCASTQVKHRHSLSANTALIAQILQRIIFTEIFCNNLQRRRPCSLASPSDIQPERV